MHPSMLSCWGGRPGKGGGFELRSSFQFKCPTPGKLTMVKRVQILRPRDINVVLFFFFLTKTSEQHKGRLLVVVSFFRLFPTRFVSY